MWLAKDWKDYELLDSGEGLKLERWGEVIMSRPDPQALWPKSDPARWGRAQAQYRRSDKGGGGWEFKRPVPESWELAYKDLKFKVRPTDFKHTGLFPEQAPNWDWAMGLIRASKRPTFALNLFGYTGAATVAMAKAGAQVTHVDAAKGMVNWCKENAAVNGLEKAPIRYLVEDVGKYCERELKRGRKYDAIVMDPPSYGRGKEGETWKLEKHLWPLLESCGKLLSDKPLFFLINSYTAGLSPTVAENLLRSLLKNRPGKLESGELGLPQSAGSLNLPCGICCRWESQP